MRHLMSPLDLSVPELEKLLDLASDIEKNPKKYAHTCDDKRLATLFYEPSTRTRLSFEAAMLNLGGNSLEAAYKVLEILPTATDEEVRAAYRKLVLKHHPDRVATLGEDIKRAAEEKLQDINNAKEIIYKARGIK